MPDREPIEINDATEFIQTNRTGWITKLTGRELVEILPPRPPEQLTLLTDTNRPISAPHTRGIVNFLNSTPDWALPGLILAVDPETVQKGQGGTIRIPREKIRVLDGQHRLQALSECIQATRAAVEQGKEDLSKLNALTESEFPVAIFEVGNIGDQQQMFAWFARSKPIEAATREWFDRSDPFNNAAKYAIQESGTLSGRIDTKRARTSRPTEDPGLMTLGELKGITTAIAIGVRRNARNTDREMYLIEEKQAELQENLIRFFDEFLPNAGEAYGKLQEEDQSKDAFQFQRRETYHMYPQVIRLFANCWARLEIDQNISTEALGQQISQVNLNRSNPENYLRKELKVIQHDRERFLRPNDIAWDEATMFINQRARSS